MCPLQAYGQALNMLLYVNAAATVPVLLDWLSHFLTTLKVVLGHSTTVTIMIDSYRIITIVNTVTIVSLIKY